MPSKLARSLPLYIRGQMLNVNTPLLVPSFSSKASVNIGHTFDTLQPSITDTLLVSAYDVFHKNIQVPPNAFAELLFLDSGGYEIAKDYEVVDPQYADPAYPLQIQRNWNTENYRYVLKHIDPIMPTIVTAFDHPDIRQPISRQIETALGVFKDFPNLGREILIKPETEDQPYVPIQRLIAEVGRFLEFDIIGMTESELGESVLERMANIARLRQAMNSAKVTKPLHIFGSLDPVCTPLYFLAGADIFDGLSWLRFSYREDLAVYHKNHGPLEFGAAEKEGGSLVRSLEANLHYLRELSGRLKRYLIDRDVKRLERHHAFFAKSLDNLRVQLPGVV